MTKMVKDLADEVCDGRLVLTLEGIIHIYLFVMGTKNICLGGYELQPLANTCAASAAQLFLPNTVPDQQIPTLKRSLNAIKPNVGAVESLRQVISMQKDFWKFSDQVVSPNFKFWLPTDWRATDSISTRPRRDKKPVKIPIVEGY